MIGRLCEIGAIVCNTGVWAAAGTAVSQPHISHEQIIVSLPIFLGAIAATALFTWGVAKYDAAKTKKLLHLEAKIDKTFAIYSQKQDTLDGRVCSLDERMDRIETLIQQLIQEQRHDPRGGDPSGR